MIHRSTTLGPKPDGKWRKHTGTTAVPGTSLIIDREPDLTIRFFHNEGDVIIRHSVRGVMTERAVAFDRLADTFAGGGYASGLLPPAIIATGQRQGVPFFVLYVAAQRSVVMYGTEQGTPTRFVLPTPPLIFGGHGTNYRLFAVPRKRRPTNEQTPLAVPPFPNTYENGSICWGSAWSQTGEKLPSASPATLARVLKRLLEESVFTHSGAGSRSKRFPDNLYGLWHQLTRTNQQIYPIEDLRMSRYTLHDFIAGTIWGERA